MRRNRVSLTGLMALIAALGLLFAFIRPLGPRDAVRYAKAYIANERPDVSTEGLEWARVTWRKDQHRWVVTYRDGDRATISVLVDSKGRIAGLEEETGKVTYGGY